MLTIKSRFPRYNDPSPDIFRDRHPRYLFHRTHFDWSSPEKKSTLMCAPGTSIHCPRALVKSTFSPIRCRTSLSHAALGLLP